MLLEAIWVQKHTRQLLTNKIMYCKKLKLNKDWWKNKTREKWGFNRFGKEIQNKSTVLTSAKLFALCKFIQSYSKDWLTAAAHVRPSQNTQKRCATPTHPVYDGFSATPAGKISLFSNLFSLSIRATAYGTLSPLLTSLKLQIWTLVRPFSALSTFRVFLLMSL